MSPQVPVKRNLFSRTGRKTSSSLLPTHVSPPTTSPRARVVYSSAGEQKSCSNALFGGHYYPSKDKRRRRVRSLPWIRLMSGAGVLWMSYKYLAKRHLSTLFDTPLPPANHVTHSHHSAMVVLHKYKLHGDLTQLPTLEWERQRELDRRKHWDLDRRVPGTHTQVKAALLEQMVPEWAHRNKVRIANGQNYKTKHASDHDSDQAQDQDEPETETDIDIDEQSTPSSQLRTVQTMTTDGNCPELSGPPTISLVIQSSLDRIWLLKETCKRWTSPIVLVIHISQALPDDEPPPWSDLLAVCQHIKVVPYSTPELAAWQYPINQLRNAGLSALETSHFLVLDVDFIPSTTLESVLLEYLPRASSKQALVVPAIDRKNGDCQSIQECQSRLQTNPKFIPSTFEELTDCFSAKDCIVFQSDNNWEGHHTTRTELWLSKQWFEPSDSSQPRRIPCFDSFRYEPYVALRWCSNVTPFYDERFYGYGKNKIQYIAHLRFLGYEFAVLPGGGFIVHHPHPDSKAKENWTNNTLNLHEEMDELYPQFLSELFEMHGNPHLQQCKRPKAKQKHTPRIDK